MVEHKQNSNEHKIATAEHSLPFMLAQDKRRRAEQLVLTLGRSISETAAELDLSESVLRGWLQSRCFAALRARHEEPARMASRASSFSAEQDAQRTGAHRTVFPHLAPGATAKPRVSAQTFPRSRRSFAQK